MKQLTQAQTALAHGGSTYTNQPTEIVLDGMAAGSIIGALTYCGIPGLNLFSTLFNSVVLGVAVNAIFSTFSNTQYPNKH